LRKLKKGTKALEPCPVCGDELHFSDSITQKIAIVDDDGGVDGWMCPWCESKFDYDNNLTYISMPGTKRGKA